MSTGINVTKPIKILDEGVLLTPDVSQIDFTGGVTATAVGNNVTVNVPAAGITVGTTPVTSGTVGRIFFEGSGNVVQQDSAFFWDNTNKRLGVGATPSTSVRLDVRAQGALSTDIAFRVRNSADSADIFSVRGNGDMYLPQGVINGQTITYMANTTDTLLRYSATANGSIAIGQNASIVNATYYNTVIGSTSQTGASAGLAIAIGFNSVVNSAGGIAIGDRARTSGADTIVIGTTGGNTQYSGTNSIHLGKKGNLGNNFTIDNVFLTYFNSDFATTTIKANGSFGLIGQQTFFCQNGSGAFGIDNVMGNGGNTLVVRNHTSVPSTNITDSFQQYSADITAGNAAPHFRTENGAIVKVYQETTAVAASTLVGNAGTNITDTDTFDGYTLQQVVKALKNLGILA